ncbi:putative nucleotidyltransferase, Ribonuclease H [Helianthus annuus]|nr:putative nucleotidyltransferase, Ribonuclease H [Helianthus annuus]KAJ0910698.1 putative nucleotidyltransferase, Ribonuclease H [Helianthus annuus]
MDTRKKTLEQFQQETQDNFEKFTSMIEKLVTEVQSLKETGPPNFSGTGDGKMVVNGGGGRPYLKLHFPRFSGEDPTGWIYQAEQFFDFQKVASEEHVQLASFHLDGIALQWHRWFAKTKGPMTWSEFTTALLSRFGPTDYEEPSESFHRLKQLTTVAAYIESFERLSHRVDGLSEPFLVGCFIGGLKEEIRLEVKLKKPRFLVDAMGSARLVEEKLTLQRRFSSPQRPHTINTPFKNTSGPGLLGPGPTHRLALPAPNSIRRLSNTEARERREKGLCYYCDERYVPGHKCTKPQLFMISDTTEDEEEQLVEASGEQTEETQAEISFHAISGTILPQTLRLSGRIKNKDVVVLVDGGSTHNFIDKALVDRLGLIVNHDVKFEVVVANCEKLVCTGRVKNLSILIQGYTIATDFFVLPVAACPIVLGVQWLKTLGPVEIDFQNLTIGFQLAGSSHKLQGLKGSELGALKSKECMGLDGVAMLFQISPVFDEPLHTHTPCPDIQSVLTEFDGVFHQPSGLPPKRSQDHSIPLLPGSGPVSSRPYRQPYYQKNEIERQVRELLQQGLIRPSHSPFSSPVLLVKKSDGTWRFCVDYRAINDITVKDKYPIPMIDELLDELFGATIFSKLDLRSGYHQIRVRDGDIHKTAFRTHEGHYEFVVMPFGLTNAPATFQCLMNDLFRQHLRKFVLVFFDDILVYSKSIDDHVRHLQVVLGILKANRLFANSSKCCFGVKEVNYLGHVINSNGVSVERAKIDAVLSWPVPTTAKGVRGFLGLAGYYRKFIKGFGSIAAPLHKLVGKGPFIWNEAAHKAFESLKTALTSAPTLGLPDWSKPFTIECDASGVGIGAVLTQNGKPLAYFSAPLKGVVLSWSTYEKEMLAVVKAVRKWRPYLLGRPFVVQTDHLSLKYLLEQRITTPAQARWLPKLLGYDYKIEYKPGATNRGADALSRCYELQLMSLSYPSTTLWSDIKKEVSLDPYYSKLPTSLHASSSGRVYNRDGVWFRDSAILLSPSSPLLVTVLNLGHSSPEGGHFGLHKTLAKIRSNFWWEGLKTSVKKHIRECQTCQRFKSDNMKPAGLLQPLPIPERVWEDISMDFIEGLPISNGFSVIMVVVDRLSKYAHFIPLRHPFTAATVAREFVNSVVRLHGIPSTIISDRDKVFISSFWQALFKLQGTVLCMSSSYHPQTDGQTEVVNRTLEQYLRCFTGDNPKKWHEWLPWAEYSYNTSTHASTKMMPFQVVYGRVPPKLIPYIRGTAQVQEVETYLNDRDEVLRQLRSNLLTAQNRMKVASDRHRREVEFSEGDLVYIKLQPYRQASVVNRSSAKLSPRFFGPYKILNRVGSVAYRVELPPGSLIHDVFHVSLLRRFVGTTPDMAPVTSSEAVVSPTIMQPEEILEERVVQKGKYRPKTELLVKWRGRPREEATWETKWRFVRAYPDFHLEDKVIPSGVDCYVTVEPKAKSKEEPVQHAVHA